MKVEIKRVYEDPGRADGTRILVDRLWPRGLSKERARVDLWLKDIAPSTELRKWFSHDPRKWTEFQARYRKELKSEADLLDVLKRRQPRGPLRCSMERKMKSTTKLSSCSRCFSGNEKVCRGSFIASFAVRI